MRSELLLARAKALAAAERVEDWTALMRVLGAELHQLDLPADLRPVLEAAESHWQGDPQDLASLRAVVVRFLATLGPSGRAMGHPIGRKARALSLLLQPDGDDEDRGDAAEWFVNFTSEPDAPTAEPDQSSWQSLMRALTARLAARPLPAELRPILASASRHWQGDPQDLHQLSLAVFKYLATLGPRSEQLRLAEGRAAHALLCVLLKPVGNSTDEADTEEWFDTLVGDSPPA